MYLVSLYFDEKTEEKIQSFINQVAEKTGNTFMVDGKVPPHMTVCEFATQEEEKAISTIYRYFPDAGLSADLICGFPGETKEDFEEWLDEIF